MAKVMAITNLQGELLGVVRADEIDVGNGMKIRAVPVRTTEQHHHFLDVPDHLVGKSGKAVQELHHHVRSHLPGGQHAHKK